MSAEERTITIAISREEAYDFLRELATDDEVRASVESDPGEALAKRGIRISPDLLPKEAKLASKEQIEELLLTLGDDPADKLGRPKGEVYPFHVMAFVFMFGALPFVQRAPGRDGAP